MSGQVLASWSIPSVAGIYASDHPAWSKASTGLLKNPSFFHADVEFGPALRQLGLKFGFETADFRGQGFDIWRHVSSVSQPGRTPRAPAPAFGSRKRLRVSLHLESGRLIE